MQSQAHPNGRQWAGLVGFILVKIRTDWFQGWSVLKLEFGTYSMGLGFEKLALRTERVILGTEPIVSRLVLDSI